jgi:hypothetical protein
MVRRCVVLRDSRATEGIKIKIKIKKKEEEKEYKRERAGDRRHRGNLPPCQEYGSASATNASFRHIECVVLTFQRQ